MLCTGLVGLTVVPKHLFSAHTTGKLVVAMGKHHRKARRPRRRLQHTAVTAMTVELPEGYRRASRLAAGGQYDEARRLYGELDVATSNTRLRALIGNDLAALDAMKGDFSAARQGWEAALAIDETCRPARLNLELLVNRLGVVRGREGEAEAHAARTEPRPPTQTKDALGAGLTTPPSMRPQVSPVEAEPHPRATNALGVGLMTPPSARPQVSPADATSIPEQGSQSLKVFDGDTDEPSHGVVGATSFPGTLHSGSPTRVAILSFLFNWPSTGGGNIHTVELATFLGRAGYEIRHFYACYPEWGIGRVGDGLPFQSDALEFDASDWCLDEIKARYRQTVQSFDPDYVIITDAWNIKPILAEAVDGYPYYLRF
jgi:hypothetical protein